MRQLSKKSRDTIAAQWIVQRIITKIDRSRSVISGTRALTDPVKYKSLSKEFMVQNLKIGGYQR